MIGPCSPSVTHSWSHSVASNRPNAFGGLPSGRVFSSRRAKWRCRVRAEGAHPRSASMIRAICAAVRAGCSRFSRAASSSTAASVRGPPAVRPGPARRTRRPATPGSSGPDWPETPSPAPRTGRHAPGRPARGPACPAPTATAPDRPAAGAANSGTARSPAPETPATTSSATSIPPQRFRDQQQ